MSTAPQVSIIIPVYNGSKYLNETVSSVLNQSYIDFEIIIVNDGSTDNTEDIVHQLQKIDSRISYYKNINSGVSISRNFGLEQAHGEFIVFLDADDIINPDFLQSRVAHLLNNPHIGVCGSGVNIINENSNPDNTIASMHAPGENMLADILYYTPGITTVPSNFMHRVKLLVDNKIYFDKRLNSSADRLFLCKLALVTQAYCLPVKNFCYRVHSNSMYHDPKRKKSILNDNELFIKILITEHIVPLNMMNLFLKKNYYMLAGSSWNAGLYLRSMLYGFKYYLIKIKIYFHRFLYKA